MKIRAANARVSGVPNRQGIINLRNYGEFNVMTHLDAIVFANQIFSGSIRNGMKAKTEQQLYDFVIKNAPNITLNSDVSDSDKYNYGSNEKCNFEAVSTNGYRLCVEQQNNFTLTKNGTTYFSSEGTIDGRKIDFEVNMSDEVKITQMLSRKIIQ
jgi:hypothetical protein